MNSDNDRNDGAKNGRRIVTRCVARVRVDGDGAGEVGNSLGHGRLHWLD